MIKIFCLLVLILLALDGILRDGHLLEVFLSHEMHVSFFIKCAYIIIGLGSVALLIHSIIWEYFVFTEVEDKKTPRQIQREEEEAERIRLEQEELERIENEKKRIEREKLKDLEFEEHKDDADNRKYFL